MTYFADESVFVDTGINLDLPAGASQKPRLPKRSQILALIRTHVAQRTEGQEYQNRMMFLCQPGKHASDRVMNALCFANESRRHVCDPVIRPNLFVVLACFEPVQTCAISRHDSSLRNPNLHKNTVRCAPRYATRVTMSA
jgi:hypothetical protein